MIRGTTDPQSSHAMVVMTPGNGVAFQHRDAPGGFSFGIDLPGISVPHWVRITRQPIAGPPGRFEFSGFHSFDGVNWISMGPAAVVAMDSKALAGMAVTSHTVTSNDPNDIVGLEELNEATFERISLQ
jgi:hypothetical protein